MEHESTERPTSDSGVEAETPARRQTDTLSREADSQPCVAEHADANANAHEHAGTAGEGAESGSDQADLPLRRCRACERREEREGRRVPVARIKNMQTHICRRCTLHRAKVNEVSL